MTESATGAGIGGDEIHREKWTKGSGPEPDPLPSQYPGPIRHVKDGAFGRRRLRRSKILDKPDRTGVLCYQGLEGQVCLPGRHSKDRKRILPTASIEVSGTGFQAYVVDEF